MTPRLAGSGRTQRHTLRRVHDTPPRSPALTGLSMWRALRINFKPSAPLVRTMTSAAIQPGAISSAQLRVQSSDLASAISSDSQDAFPGVFATARLVALMEIASARALKPLLQPGQLSVGVSIDMTHTALTPPSAEVTAEATYRDRHEKLQVFDVVAEGRLAGLSTRGPLLMLRDWRRRPGRGSEQRQ